MMTMIVIMMIVMVMVKRHDGVTDYDDDNIVYDMMMILISR